MFFVFSDFLGTGSYPKLPKGLHLKIRRHASQRPLMLPWIRTASIVYAEQEGKNLQWHPSMGEMHFWYNCTSAMVIFCMKMIENQELDFSLSSV